MTWSSDSETAVDVEAGWRASLSHLFTEHSEQYCAQIEATSLIDGSVAMLPQPCSPHGDLGTLGVSPRPENQIGDWLLRCTEPPPGWKADWCDVELALVAARRVRR